MYFKEELSGVLQVFLRAFYLLIFEDVFCFSGCLRQVLFFFQSAPEVSGVYAYCWSRLNFILFFFLRSLEATINRWMLVIWKLLYDTVSAFK